MSAIVSYIVAAVLDWLRKFISGVAERYAELARKAEERERENKQSEQKLEEAKSEQEVIDAGSDHLRRN